MDRSTTAEDSNENTGRNDVLNRKLNNHIPPARSWSSVGWCLPSGQRLAEFVLQAGFLTPLLFPTPLGRTKRASVPVRQPKAVEGRR